MRVKEIIAIVIIILITIALAILPGLDFKIKDNPPEIHNNEDLISITLEGEINAPDKNDEVSNKMTIPFPKGVSYGYIISKIKIYLTKYSIIDLGLNQRFYEDSRILIKSSAKIIDEPPNANEAEGNKININKASYDDLIKIKGIKEIRAKKIIEYRRVKRIESFKELQDIIYVSDEWLEKIKREAVL